MDTVTFKSQREAQTAYTKQKKVYEAARDVVGALRFQSLTLDHALKPKSTNDLLAAEALLGEATDRLHAIYTQAKTQGFQLTSKE